MDYVGLNTSPVEEECAQLSKDDYYERSAIECQVWKRQLLRAFPIPESLIGKASYKTKSFDHDAGPVS